MKCKKLHPFQPRPFLPPILPPQAFSSLTTRNSPWLPAYFSRCSLLLQAFSKYRLLSSCFTLTGVVTFSPDMARSAVLLSACTVVLLFASVSAQTSIYDQNVVSLAKFLLNTTDYSDFGNMLNQNCRSIFFRIHVGALKLNVAARIGLIPAARGIICSYFAELYVIFIATSLVLFRLFVQTSVSSSVVSHSRT